MTTEGRVQFSHTQRLCPVQNSLQEGMKCVWAVWCCCFAITLGQHYVIVSPHYELWESRLKFRASRPVVRWNSLWLIFHVLFPGSNELPYYFPPKESGLITCCYILKALPPSRQCRISTDFSVSYCRDRGENFLWTGACKHKRQN